MTELTSICFGHLKINLVMTEKTL